MARPLTGLLVALAAPRLGAAWGAALPEDNPRAHLREEKFFHTDWLPPRLLDGAVPSRERYTDLALHGGELPRGPWTWSDVLYPIQWERDFEAVKVAGFCRRWWWGGCFASSLYLLGLWVGSSAMKDKEPYNLKVPLALWNLLLAAFSLLGAARTVPHLLTMLGTYGFDYTVCRAALAGYGSGAVGLWVALFVFSKYAELVDTIFLIARKKPVPFLHWYHHCSVLVYCWHAYVYEMPTGIYFAAMNYTVHAIMYFYYFLTAVLARPPKWARTVTVLQLAQMAVGIGLTLRHLHVLLYAVVPNCDGHIPNLAGALGMYASYFILFAQFFAKRYAQRKGTPGRGNDKKLAEFKRE